MIQVCRTCLQVVNKDSSCIALNTNDELSDYPSIRNKLLSCVPELAVDMVQCAVICTSCLKSLDAAFNFKNKCLRTEERILNYAHLVGCSAGFINISDVIQHEERSRDYVDDSEVKHHLDEMHYPITQIIEQDTDVDIKPLLDTRLSSNSDGIDIKAEHEDENDKQYRNMFLPELSFGPELDVMVVSYKNNSVDNHVPQVEFQQNPVVKQNFYHCSICREVFYQLAVYESHQLMHIENRPLKCTMCERRFVRKDKLRLHMRIHTGEKPFNCTECGRCFSRKDKLKNHMRTHTGEKPHQCILCQKCFARKDKMNNHMRSQHWLALANLEISVVKNEVKPELKMPVEECQ